jgi:hypothetical protein
MARAAGGREDERGGRGAEGERVVSPLSARHPNSPGHKTRANPCSDDSRTSPPPLTARIAVFKYIVAFYNDSRLQQTLGW